MNDAFSHLHPAASFVFFAAVITLTMLYMHPVLLIISLTAAAGYVCILKGARHFGKTLIYLVPFLLFMSALNALFNHAGVTPLFIFQRQRRNERVSDLRLLRLGDVQRGDTVV